MKLCLCKSFSTDFGLIRANFCQIGILPQDNRTCQEGHARLWTQRPEPWQRNGHVRQTRQRRQGCQESGRPQCRQAPYEGILFRARPVYEHQHPNSALDRTDHGSQGSSSTSSTKESWRSYCVCRIRGHWCSELHLTVTSKPKNAAKDKPKPATAQKTSGRGRAPLRRGRNAGRGKPKSASELDAEMVDYFGNEASGPVNGAVQPVANGEAAMEDEIM